MLSPYTCFHSQCCSRYESKRLRTDCVTMPSSPIIITSHSVSASHTVVAMLSRPAPAAQGHVISTSLNIEHDKLGLTSSKGQGCSRDYALPRRPEATEVLGRPSHDSQIGSHQGQQLKRGAQPLLQPA